MSPHDGDNTDDTFSRFWITFRVNKTAATDFFIAFILSVFLVDIHTVMVLESIHDFVC